MADRTWISRWALRGLEMFIQMLVGTDFWKTDARFLEDFLQRDPSNLRNGELLWQYYVKNGCFLKSAETLLALAESSRLDGVSPKWENADGLHRFELTLDRRIEFLSLAVGTAKSHPVSELGRQETAIAFLTELEEKLEVAQAQLQILNTIKHEIDSPSPSIQQKVHELTSNLKNVTEVCNVEAQWVVVYWFCLAVWRFCGSTQFARDETDAFTCIRTSRFSPCCFDMAILVWSL